MWTFIITFVHYFILLPHVLLRGKSCFGIVDCTWTFFRISWRCQCGNQILIRVVIVLMTLTNLYVENCYKPKYILFCFFRLVKAFSFFCLCCCAKMLHSRMKNFKVIGLDTAILRGNSNFSVFPDPNQLLCITLEGDKQLCPCRCLNYANVANLIPTPFPIIELLQFHV